MRFSRFIPCIALATAMLLFASRASAQTAINKVAIANLAKILKGLQETNDLNAKIENERKNFEAQDLEKRTKIRDIQTRRDALKSDSAQYQTENKALLDASIQYEVWKQLFNADVQRNQKMQLKGLYDKITSAVAEVATQKGIDLVIAEMKPDFPDLDTINPQQLQVLMASRNVLFNTALVDISDAVITAMDAKYKAGK